MKKKKKSKKQLIQAAAVTALTGAAFVAAGPADASAATDVSKLVKQAYDSSNQLKGYYDLSKVKSISLSKEFVNAYDKAKKDIVVAEKALANVSANKSALVAQLDAAKNTQSKAARLIDAIKIGDALTAKTNELTQYINEDVIDEDMVETYHELSADINRAERVFSKVYGEQNRELVRGKFLLDAKIARESVIYEVSRYTLQDLITRQLEEGKVAEAEENFAKLDRLEKRAVEIKAEGNKLHPGKYPELRKMADSLKEAKEVIESGFTITVEATSTDASKPTIYGEDEVQTIEKDVVVTVPKGTFIELKNLEVKGNIILKGADGSAGKVTLTNVNVTGSVKVEEQKVVSTTKGISSILDIPVPIQLILGKTSIIGELVLNQSANITAETGVKIPSLVISPPQGLGVVSLNGDLSSSKVTVGGQGAEVKLGASAKVLEMILNAKATIDAENGALLQSLQVETKDKNSQVLLKGDLSSTLVKINNSNAAISVAENAVVKKIEKDKSVTDKIVVDNKGKVEDSDGVEVPGNTTVPPVSGGPTPNVPAPTPSDQTPPSLTIMNNSSVNIGNTVDIQSTELGTVYLVPSSESPTTASDLEILVTNSIAKKSSVTAVNSDINIPTQGLIAGTFKVYAVDNAGNLSSPQNITLTYISESSVSLRNLEITPSDDGQKVTFTVEIDYVNSYGTGTVTAEVGNKSGSGKGINQDIVYNTNGTVTLTNEYKVAELAQYKDENDKVYVSIGIKDSEDNYHDSWGIIEDKHFQVPIAAYNFDISDVKFKRTRLLDKAPTGDVDQIAEFNELQPTTIEIIKLDDGTDFTGPVRISSTNVPGVQLWARDSAGNWHDINRVGWGPQGGFTISDVQTDVYVLVDEAFEGDKIDVGLNLVDSDPDSIPVSFARKVVNIELGDQTAPTDDVAPKVTTASMGGEDFTVAEPTGDETEGTASITLSKSTYEKASTVAIASEDNDAVKVDLSFDVANSALKEQLDQEDLAITNGTVDLTSIHSQVAGGVTFDHLLWLDAQEGTPDGKITLTATLKDALGNAKVYKVTLNLSTDDSVQTINNSGTIAQSISLGTHFSLEDGVVKFV